MITDGCLSGVGLKSTDKIPKSLDNAMDKANPSKNVEQMGISIRNGPMEEMEIEEPNGKSLKKNGSIPAKRKGRGSMPSGKTYKEASSENEEDDKPLVLQACLDGRSGYSNNL